MEYKTFTKQVLHLCVAIPARHQNIASAIRNISTFGIEKLYIIGGPKGWPN